MEKRASKRYASGCCNALSKSHQERHVPKSSKVRETPEGIQREAEVIGRIPSTSSLKPEKDIKKGLVYKRVPHVTLKSIAINDEIHETYNNWLDRLNSVRKKLNSLLNQQWEEWHIPPKPDDRWSAEAQKLLTDWWNLWKERQKEINNIISRRVDTELLYDQPYEDDKHIRVAGPFTVESLSPHRILSTEVERPKSEIEGQKQSPANQFETMIIENLKKAGVQNTKKDERLKFDRMDSYPGTWIQAEGEFTEKDGKSKRVAVCVGPEHNTVGPDLIKEAAKEAVQGIGFDLLIVCGFAFDSHVNEEARRYGKLPVLITRMNPDLAMGDELLKKTSSGNLFNVSSG